MSVYRLDELFKITTKKETEKDFISISKYYPFEVSLNDTKQKNNYYLYPLYDFNLDYVFRIIKQSIYNKKVIREEKGCNIVIMDTRGLYFIQKKEDLNRHQIITMF